MSTAELASVDALLSPIGPKRSRGQPLQQTAPETPTDPVVEALRLLKRQAQIQSDLRRFGRARVTEERELFLIRNRLAQFPAAVQAITLTAAELQRPVDTLSLRDVAARGGLPRPLARDANTHTANPR
jgi:hypothetical protein